MSEISASLVKELRERTGMGMMDCKQALVTAKGDISLAIEELRKSSGIKASKKAGRSAADGVIRVEINNSKAFMVEINCETDFVAKDESFMEFSDEVLNTLSSGDFHEVEQLMKGDLQDKREKLIQKLGENIVVRRMFQSDDSADHTGVYLHSNKKIACVTSLRGGNDEAAKDIAMHIAATDPLAISPNDIPIEILEKEKEIFEAQSADSGKPKDIVVKMVEGKVKKFVSEVSLTEQDFVKDPGVKIKSLLDKNNAQVIQFKRFEVGEGIEVEETDFAAEVMSQIKKS
ncbi:MAG TPA: elongation factor Ts [Gammaproteobacteria bacterium]|jgi:elongation factor Ts|nr:elongation factor Ts [Gammaproteobacteria bacterium]